ncbi:MAG: D-alanine--D-alanine ligase [Planctomycetes bacterium]|nr:D-alanine--D-alanine ligase [Planctomycetota bacterium]
MHIALLFNQKSDPDNADPDDQHGACLGAEAEWDSPDTILAVADALATEHQVTRIEADDNAFESLRKLRPDLVFNIAEGRHGAGREAQVPALLEMLDIPYTGSDPVTLGICLDKSRAKEILAYHGIPTARFAVVESAHELNGQVSLPAIAKPLWEGSSKGITDDCLLRDRDALRWKVGEMVERYRQPVLVEEYLPGREFTAALLGNGPDARVLPLVEMDFSVLPAGANPIYSYEAKWVWDDPSDPMPVHQCPAEVDEGLQKAVEDTARRAFRVLRCRDWARIDLRLSGDGVPNVIEINPLPGILPNPEDHSCFPAASRAAGISYAEMVLAVVREACRRYGIA